MEVFGVGGQDALAPVAYLLTIRYAHYAVQSFDSERPAAALLALWFERIAVLVEVFDCARKCSFAPRANDLTVAVGPCHMKHT